MATREVKVVLLGDTGVGKSSLVLRFVTQDFKEYSESTIGASFMSKVEVIDGTAYKYQIWDTAGQEKYHSLAPMYYRGAAAAIIVYDITNARSFEKTQAWVEELQRHGPENIVLVVAGNKADLDDKRVVGRDKAEGFAKGIGAIFLETSAKTGQSVGDAFKGICARLKPLGDDDDDDEKEAQIGGTGGAKKQGCC
jgi:Ras-related protein Rab-22